MAKTLINFREENGIGAFPNETPMATRLVSSMRSFLASDPVPYPPVLVPVTLVLDLSKWQGDIDFQLMYERGIRMVVIKSNQGLWLDGKFEQNIQNALAAGMIVGVYEYLDPSQVDAEQAARFHYDITKGTGCVVSWMDGEKTGGLTKAGLYNYYVTWYETLAGLVNGSRKIEAYSRMSYWRDYVARSNFWRNNNVLLNAARYHLGLKTPWSDGRYLPVDWDYGILEFDWWQYLADGNGLGPWFGCESGSVDLNLRACTLEQLIVYYTGQTPPDPDPEPTPTDLLVTLFTNQSLRSEPSTVGGSTTVIKRLPKNSILTVTPDEEGSTLFVPGLAYPKDVWVHVMDPAGVMGWVAIYHPSRSTVYLQTVD